MKLRIKNFRRRSLRGFSLIETAVALAIVSFSCTCLLSLLPASLNAFHQAMGNTVESQIVQSISNDLELDNFSTLTGYVTSPPTFYYDHEGQLLPNPTGACYTVTVGMNKVTSVNSPADLDSASATSVAAYNVSVSISSTSQPHAHVYSVIIANNGL